MSFQIFPLLIALLLPMGLLAAKHKGDKESKWEEIMGRPPLSGSVEEAQDLAITMELQNTRTEEDCANAAKEESVKLDSFFGGEHGPLSAKEVKKLKIFFLRKMLTSGIAASKAKNYFQRPRPFQAFPQVKPCIKLSSGLSYPSGHTTVSRYVAHALGIKYPERRDLFLQRADEIAHNRVLGGVHYQSDIEAGKLLADQLAEENFDQNFVQELLEQ